MGYLYICDSKTTAGVIKVGISMSEKHLSVRFRFHGKDGYRGQIFDTDSAHVFAYECADYKEIENEIKDRFASYRIGNTELYINVKKEIISFVEDYDKNGTKVEVAPADDSISETEAAKLNLADVEAEEENEKKYDATKYSINNGPALSKTRLVFETLKMCVEAQPTLTIQEIRNIFSSKGYTVTAAKMFLTREEYLRLSEKYRRSSYHPNPIFLHDGDLYAYSTWRSETALLFINDVERFIRAHNLKIVIK
jgi:hypothetical protein